MRQMFVAGNWKMHGSKASIKTLATGLRAQSSKASGVKVAVCPPSIYIDYAAACLGGSGIGLGAQNVAVEANQGAFTGEISVSMAKDASCRYVIVGHSERRSLFGETDEVVADKVATVLEAGLTPIFCIGETLSERESGQLETVLSNQVNAVLNRVGVDAFSDIVIAYEPVWAIGTGVTATSQQAQDVHAFIRGLIAAKNPAVAESLIIQYGGSVKPNNAKELFSMPDIDGGLIGGASLNADDFMAICEAAGA